MNKYWTSFFLLALVIITGCKKDDGGSSNTQNSNGSGGNGYPGTATLNVNTPRGVILTVDGTTYNYTEGSPFGAQTNNYGTQVAPPAQSTARLYYGIGSFAVNFGTYNYVGNDLSITQLFNFFSVGAMEYGYPITDMDRVQLLWNQAGSLWTTSGGSSDQTGSNFTIEEAMPVSPAGINYVLLRVSFNCTFYNQDTGESKSVTNGTGVFTIQNI